MSGINVIQTGKDIGSFFNSWVTYVNSAQQYKKNPNDPTAKQALISSAGALASAIGTLGENPRFASALGALAGVTDLPNQVQAYQDALAVGNTNNQTAAFSSIAGDAASIAGTAAATVGAWATAIGNSGLASLMVEIGEHANEFALFVGAIGTAVDVGNWANSTFFPGFDKWIGNTPPRLDQDQLLNLNGTSGNSEIIMPGQNGDTLAKLPLSGNAFRFTESNTQGVQTSSVQLAYNGSAYELAVEGAGVVADVGSFQINLANGASANINGSANTIKAGVNSFAALYGTGNVVEMINNAGSIVRFTQAGAANTISGTGNYIGMFASGNTVNSSGNVFQFAGAGYSTNINGDSNKVQLTSGSLATLYGTGNLAELISNSGSIVRFTQAGATNTVSGSGNYIGMFTSGGTVNSSGNVFQFAGTGYSTNINGDSNKVQLTSGSLATLYGTGNLVQLINNSGSIVRFTEAGAVNTVGGSGNYIGMYASGDFVNSSGNVFQFAGTGYSTQINGDSNKVQLTAGSLATLYGTGNLVELINSSGSIAQFAGAGAVNTVSGSGNYIGIYASGGIVNSSGNVFQFAAGGLATNINGDRNDVQLTAGSSAMLYGTGNLVELINSSGSIARFAQANTVNTVTGSGNTIGVLASGNTVNSTGNVFQFSTGGLATNINGSSNYVQASVGSISTLYGTGNFVDLVNSSGSIARFTQANTVNTVTGSGNAIGVFATGDTVNSTGNTIQFASGGLSTTLNGNGNFTSTSLGDSLSVAGGGNSITMAQGSRVQLSGTTANPDIIYASGVDCNSLTANGQQTGIWLGSSTQAVVNGNNNQMSCGSGSTVLANGSGDMVWGSGCNIQMGPAANRGSLVVYGDNNIIDMSPIVNAHPGGIGASITVYGSHNVIYAYGAHITTYGSGNIDAGAYNILGGNGIKMGGGSAGYQSPFYYTASSGGSSPSSICYDGGNGTYVCPVTPTPINVTPLTAALQTPASATLTGEADASDTPVTSPVAALAAPGTRTSAPLSHPVLFDTQDSEGSANMSTSTDSDDNQDLLNANGNYQGLAVAADTTDEGSTVDAQLQNLIAAMASFAAESSASSTLMSPAQNDPQMLLAANAY